MARIAPILAILIVGAVVGPQPASACVSFGPPVVGPITAGYAPVGAYAGHWGVDFDTEVDTPIQAAESGTVTWAGPVVDNLSVTIHHGGGLRSSYSYLSAVLVNVGDRVTRGTVIGLGGDDHLHFSVRIGSAYIDPMSVLTCVQGAVSSGLRLVPVSYPPAGATRHSGRHVRSSPHRPSSRGRDRLSPTRPRRSAVHPGGGPLAEVRPSCL